MKRTLVWPLAIAALGLLGWWWFARVYEQVEVQIPVGPSATARANPYLAAMRFAEHTGWKANIEEPPTRSESLAPRTIVLLPAGRAWLTETRARALLQSAESGAHLVVEPEAEPRHDALLAALQLAVRSGKPFREHFVATFPGVEAPLNVAVIDDRVIDLDRIHADIVLRDEAGARLASMRRGAGRVTVVNSMRRFDNQQIGRHDHAELLHRLLALVPADRLLVVRAQNARALWPWLFEHASGAMIATALVLALALWRILPRFGPILPGPDPVRRQLLEHLRAAGRFRWSQGARSELLGAAREQLERHITAAAPRLAHLPPPQRHTELSVQLNTDAKAVERAFGAVPRNARDLVQATATLATIHAGLRGARRRFTPRRKRR